MVGDSFFSLPKSVKWESADWLWNSRMAGVDAAWGTIDPKHVVTYLHNPVLLLDVRPFVS